MVAEASKPATGHRSTTAGAREWHPAFEAAGPPPRRIYGMRHSFAIWALAAGLSIFELARYMGTSVEMIDRT